jgi:hypothetical protein
MRDARSLKKISQSRRQQKPQRSRARVCPSPIPYALNANARALELPQLLRPSRFQMPLFERLGVIVRIRQVGLTPARCAFSFAGRTVATCDLPPAPDKCLPGTGTLHDGESIEASTIDITIYRTVGVCGVVLVEVIYLWFLSYQQVCIPDEKSVS